MLSILKQAANDLTLVGIDSSQPMLDLCRVKLESFSNKHQIILDKENIEDLTNLKYGEAGVVILCLVLQFMRPMLRKKVLATIYNNLARGGCILMVEKTIQKNPTINQVYLDWYHDYKLSSGYSMLEIAKKREALENVLIPFHLEENILLLQEAGFSAASIFFSILNFQGYIGVKE